MRNMTRREFTRKSSLVGVGLAASSFVAFTGKKFVRKSETSVFVPMPIQIVIDDVSVSSLIALVLIEIISRQIIKQL